MRRDAFFSFLANAQYIDAEEAFRSLSFEVRSGEEVVATGVADGPPVELPPGPYTVRVLADPPKDLTGVAIESEKQREVTY